MTERTQVFGGIITIIWLVRSSSGWPSFPDPVAVKSVDGLALKDGLQVLGHEEPARGGIVNAWGGFSQAAMRSGSAQPSSADRYGIDLFADLPQQGRLPASQSSVQSGFEKNHGGYTQTGYDPNVASVGPSLHENPSARQQVQQHSNNALNAYPNVVDVRTAVRGWSDLPPAIALEQGEYFSQQSVLPHIGANPLPLIRAHDESGHSHSSGLYTTPDAFPVDRSQLGMSSLTRLASSSLAPHSHDVIEAHSWQRPDKDWRLYPGQHRKSQYIGFEQQGHTSDYHKSHNDLPVDDVSHSLIRWFQMGQKARLPSSSDAFRNDNIFKDVILPNPIQEYIQVNAPRHSHDALHNAILRSPAQDFPQLHHSYSSARRIAGRPELALVKYRTNANPGDPSNVRTTPFQRADHTQPLETKVSITTILSSIVSPSIRLDIINQKKLSCPIRNIIKNVEDFWQGVHHLRVYKTEDYPQFFCKELNLRFCPDKQLSRPDSPEVGYQGYIRLLDSEGQMMAENVAVARLECFLARIWCRHEKFLMHNGIHEADAEELQKAFFEWLWENVNTSIVPIFRLFKYKQPLKLNLFGKVQQLFIQAVNDHRKNVKRADKYRFFDHTGYRLLGIWYKFQSNEMTWAHDFRDEKVFFLSLKAAMSELPRKKKQRTS